MKKILFIDNYDSFSQTVIYYLLTNNIKSHIIKNNSNINVEILENYDGLVISPGPGTVYHSGICTDFLKYALSKNIPVLGICLGHQVICQYFGSDIIQTSEPLHGFEIEIKHDNSKLFTKINPIFKMACYNSLVATTPDNNELQITAFSTIKKYIMAVQHKFKPVFGIQFHPESFMSKNGNQIFKNFKDFL